MPSHTKIPIRYRTLLLIHIILPAIGFLIISDILFLKGMIQTSLPKSLQDLVFYTIVFNLPHIIASFFWFADKEYLSHYKQRFIKEIPLLLLGLTLLILYSPMIATRVFLAYTLYHVVTQQMGIFLSFAKKIPKAFIAWKWTGITSIISAIIYGTAAGPYSLKHQYPELKSIFYSDTFLIINVCLILGFAILTLQILKCVETKEGSWYGFLTFATFATSAICMLLGYPLLGLLAMRVVHDLTAFVFYITHEQNRNAEELKNPIYKFFYLLGIPFAIIVPTLAILVAFPLSITLHTTNLFFLILVSCLHYYTESFVWKRGTIHRAQIFFKT